MDRKEEISYPLACRDVRDNIAIIAALTLASKKDLSKLTYEQILNAFEKEIDNFQKADMDCD
jgi:hypothetical protein